MVKFKFFFISDKKNKWCIILLNYFFFVFLTLWNNEKCASITRPPRLQERRTCKCDVYKIYLPFLLLLLHEHLNHFDRTRHLDLIVDCQHPVPEQYNFCQVQWPHSLFGLQPENRQKSNKFVCSVMDLSSNKKKPSTHEKNKFSLEINQPADCKH